MRVLLVERISREDPASTSLARQAEELAKAAAVHDWEVVATVRDSTVSGGVDLSKRPSLGKWLREPLVGDWDALAAVSQDRISRDDLHWWAFVAWALDNGKQLVILDDPGLDLTTEEGRMLAGIKAGMAAKYRSDISKKRRKQTSWHREQGFWKGGALPLGYRPVVVQHMDKRRFKLEHDLYGVELIREAFRRIVEQGQTVNEVAADWNQRGVLTSADRSRQILGKPTQGALWHRVALKNLLTSQSLKGIQTYKGQPVLRDGIPVRWCAPILTDEEFDRLQVALRALAVKFSRGTPRHGSGPHVGVLFCGCGSKLHAANPGGRGKRSYFRCASTKAPRGGCPLSHSWPREPVLAVLEDAFLKRMGDQPVTVREFTPGGDHRHRMAELEAAIENLAQGLAQARSAEVVATLTRSMDAHAGELERLRKEPVRKGSWTERPTGQTWAERWKDLDGWDERLHLLRKAGFRAFVAPDLEEPGYFAVWVVTPAEVERAGAVPEDWDKTAHRLFLRAVASESE
jgi:site-specific DNA recombinase